jgi:hypothetical protein
MDGFFYVKNVLSLFKYLKSLYPEFISDFFSIGSTFEGKDIPALTLGKLSTQSKPRSLEAHLGQKKRSLEDELSSPYQNEKSNILFTALHHAREPLTLSMIVYIFLVNLHILIHTNWENLVRNSNIFDEDVQGQTISEKFFLFGNLIFVPAVNLDSYLLINEAHGTENFEKIKGKRKNMNMNTPCMKFKSEEDIDLQKKILSGVDINRNYDIKFDQDNIGSVDDPCDETYRGRNMGCLDYIVGDEVSFGK